MARYTEKMLRLAYLISSLHYLPLGAALYFAPLGAGLPLNLALTRLGGAALLAWGVTLLLGMRYPSAALRIGLITVNLLVVAALGGAAFGAVVPRLALLAAGLLLVAAIIALLEEA